jgi:hypothetical protein
MVLAVRGWDGIIQRQILQCVQDARLFQTRSLEDRHARLCVPVVVCPSRSQDGLARAVLSQNIATRSIESTSTEADTLDYAVRLLDKCDKVGMEHDLSDQGENLAKNKGGGGCQRGIFGMER